MSQSWAELIRVADSNSRSAAEKIEEERRKREKVNQKTDRSRSVDQTAIQMILERRRREQEQQKLAEQQRLKKAEELKKQQKAAVQSKKQPPQKAIASQPPPPPRPSPSIVPPKPPATVRKPAPAISYDDLMRYASLKDNNQPIPKELAYVATALRARSTSTPSASSTKSSSSNPPKQSVPPPKPSTTTTNLKKPTATKAATTNKSSVQTKPKPNTSLRTSNSTKPPVKNPIANGQKASVNGQKLTQPARTNGSNVPPANRPSTGQKVPQNQTSSVQRLPNNGQRPTVPNGTLNGRRSVPPARVANGQRPSVVPSQKRPAVDDSEDEYDEEMRDFIVDDEDDNGFDYRKELQETLKKNFRFDKERYRSRFLDDDEDDLRNMESSFDQIEREEDFSRRQGLREDIEDVLREEAEKKSRTIQAKKRPKTGA